MIFLLLAMLSLLTPTKVEAASPSFFPIGMFEDANMTNTSTGFENMITNLRSHNLDTVLFTNSNNTTHLPLLDVSDRLNFNVIWGGPMHELTNNWFNNAINATSSNAETIIGPLVDQLKSHPSLKGYNLLDDTTLSKADKLKLAIDVYKNHDQKNSATAVFVNGHEKAFTTSGSETFLTYYYPAKAYKNACDWNFISPTQNDFSNNIRNVTRYKPQSIPLWNVLQTHGSVAITDPAANVTTLRVPTPQEVSLQNWIAIGEGSKGMFWFIYSTQQFWTGLKDNSTLFNQVSSISARTKLLAPTLIKLQKTADYFGLNGSGNRYISTLVDPTNGKYYVLIANALCNGNQQLTPTSTFFNGNLQDLESGTQFGINTPVSVSAGDAKIFEVINSNITIPVPPSAPNLFVNPSFETKSGNFPANWGSQISSIADSTVAHSGTNSFKLTGLANVYVNQKLNLKPASLYTLSYWIKSPSGMTGNGVTFRAVSTDTLTPVTGVSSTNGTAFDWKQIKETFYTPTTYLDSRFDLMWDLKTGETVYLDDLSLCEGQDCVPKTAILATSSKPGDTDNDGDIDIFDYNTFLTDYGKVGTNINSDFDKNGKVDIFDYNTLLTNFGI